MNKKQRTLAQAEAQQPLSKQNFDFYKEGLISVLPLPETVIQDGGWLEGMNGRQAGVEMGKSQELMDARSARLIDGLLTGYLATTLAADRPTSPIIRMTSAAVLYLLGEKDASLDMFYTCELGCGAEREIRRLGQFLESESGWPLAETTFDHRFSIQFRVVEQNSHFAFTEIDWDNPLEDDEEQEIGHSIQLNRNICGSKTLETVLSLRPGILRTLEAQDTEESRSAEMLYRLLESWRKPEETAVQIGNRQLMWGARVMREELPLTQRLDLLRPGLEALQTAGGLESYQLSEEGLQVTLLPQHPTENRQEDRSLLHDLGLADHLIDALLRGHSPEEFGAALKAWHQHRGNADPANPGGLLLWLLKRPDLSIVDTKHVMGLLEPDTLENQPDSQSR